MNEYKVNKFSGVISKDGCAISPNRVVERLNELQQQNDDLKAYVNEAKQLVDLALRGGKHWSELESAFGRFDARTPKQSLAEAKVKAIRDMLAVPEISSTVYGHKIIILSCVELYLDYLLNQGGNNES